jgi:hypothetical protein
MAFIAHFCPARESARRFGLRDGDAPNAGAEFAANVEDRLRAKPGRPSFFASALQALA